MVNSYKKNGLEEKLTTKASRGAFTHHSVKHEFLFKSNDCPSNFNIFPIPSFLVYTEKVKQEMLMCCLH